MKICIGCGMPMKEASDFAMSDTTKDYCIHCARPDGELQSFEEKRDSLSDFIMKTQSLDKQTALLSAETVMKDFPAWKGHFE